MKYMARVLGLVLTLLPMFAAAQLSPSDRIVTNVPFDFMIASKIVPAGEWILQMPSGVRATLMLNNVDERTSLYSMAAADESKIPASKYALVFHKYGERYFLSEVKLEGSRTMYRLPQSKAEKELLARNAIPTETIVLASVK